MELRQDQYKNSLIEKEAGKIKEAADKQMDEIKAQVEQYEAEHPEYNGDSEKHDFSKNNGFYDVETITQEHYQHEAEFDSHPIETNCIVDANTGAMQPVTESVVNDGLIGVDLSKDVIDQVDKQVEEMYADGKLDSFLDDLGLRDVRKLKELARVAKEYKLSDGKMTNLFSKLPEEFKAFVRAQVPDLRDRSALNNAARLIIDSFISAFDYEEFDKAFVDLHKEYDEAMKSMELGSIVKECNKSNMEVLEKALESKDIPEENKEKIRRLCAIKEECESFEFLKKHVKDYSNLRKFTKPDRYKRLIESIHYKYKNNKSKFSITDLRSVGLILKDAFIKEFDEETIACLMVLLMKVTMNYSADIPEDHAYVQFTIDQICQLKAFNPGSEDYNKIYNTIKEVLLMI